MDTLLSDYEYGGLKMINVTKYLKSLKISWMKRLLTSNNSWTTLVKQNTAQDLFCLGASTKHTIQNTFWKCVFNAW
jgi:hypothetical protein